MSSRKDITEILNRLGVTDVAKMIDDAIDSGESEVKDGYQVIAREADDFDISLDADSSDNRSRHSEHHSADADSVNTEHGRNPAAKSSRHRWGQWS